MITTGTDVKRLECLLFMRSVKSAPLFRADESRGRRVIDRDSLRTVTFRTPR